MKLPLSTRLVIFLSNFIRFNGLYIFAGLIFSTFGFIYLLKKNKTFRFYFDKSILKIPLIGDILRDYNLANSTRTIGLLLKGGVTVSEAIPIAEKTSSNLVYKEEFKKLSESINRGDKISLYLSSKPDLFPEVLSQIVSVGERSGNLSNSLIYLSELYEAQVDDFTKNLSNLIEPALMIFMGILVGFIAISIITPIYSITQNLHG
jgi:type IV pilus assembly protein PilC